MESFPLPSPTAATCTFNEAKLTLPFWCRSAPQRDGSAPKAAPGGVRPHSTGGTTVINQTRVGGRVGILRQAEPKCP